MCGILGAAANARSGCTVGDLQRSVTRLLRLSETRGRESAGIAAYDLARRAITLFKCAQPAARMIRRPEYAALFARLADGRAGGRLDGGLGLIGHSRLVTDGQSDRHDNNQPVLKDDLVGVHNGIVVNGAALWAAHPALRRAYEVDTEVLLALVAHHLRAAGDWRRALGATFRAIEGAASVALFWAAGPWLALATNTGSLYRLARADGAVHVFASERQILQALRRDPAARALCEPAEIVHLPARSACLIRLDTLTVESWALDAPVASGAADPARFSPPAAIQDIAPVSTLAGSVRDGGSRRPASDAAERWYDATAALRRLRRCARCILPDTFPFIAFDAAGVCNYCRHYQPVVLQPVAVLREQVAAYRRGTDVPDCLVLFSGGRDSCFGLHYLKRELGLNPLAYTYDWGMITDLARRNQSRLCARLGVEHILVSADIRKKREHIRRNVEAWLRRPDLGTVPLFMAGDKAFFYHAHRLMRQNDLPLAVLCENKLEKTDFKAGFCGIRPAAIARRSIYALSFGAKLRMAAYYGKRFLENPAYLNASVWDTLGAFVIYYFMPHDFLDLYRYVRWDETEIEATLRREYQWETAPDTPSTWRIGDGTAAFYNYIYATVAGFTENDTFRSNQIREGVLTREEALRRIEQENRPREEAVRWYLHTIGVDVPRAIATINRMPKRYAMGA